MRFPLVDESRAGHTCCICGHTRIDSEADLGWKIVWRMPHSYVVSVRTWDVSVMSIPHRWPACSMECAMKKAKELLAECEQDRAREQRAYELTPPKPKSKQTDFDPTTFTDRDKG